MSLSIDSLSAICSPKIYHASSIEFSQKNNKIFHDNRVPHNPHRNLCFMIITSFLEFYLRYFEFWLREIRSFWRDMGELWCLAIRRAWRMFTNTWQSPRLINCFPIFFDFHEYFTNSLEFSSITNDFIIQWKIFYRTLLILTSSIFRRKLARINHKKLNNCQFVKIIAGNSVSS